MFKSARISCLILVFLVAVLKATVAQRPEQSFESRQNQGILNAINSLRRKAGSKVSEGVTASNMRKLQWDKLLEDEARQLTTCEDLLKEDDGNVSFLEFSSSSSSTSMLEVWEWVDAAATKGVLSIRNTDATTIEEMFTDVFTEGDHFNFFTRRCHKGLNCSRYLQLSWAEADKVGCSLNSKCHHDENVHYLNCVFNVESKMLEEPFMVGEECSRCPDSAPFCDTGLCVSSCEFSKPDTCFCPKTCVHTGVGLGVLDKTSCTCECTFGTGPDCQDVCENDQIYENFDYCAEINTEEHCKNDKFLQLLFCKENCDYGCKRSPDALKIMKEHMLTKKA